MAESKGKKGKRQHGDTRSKTTELVVTFNIGRGDVIKVEALEASGNRRSLSEKEFAEIAGDDECSDLEAALEEAYAAGISDAIEDSIDGLFDTDEDEEIRRSILRDTATKQLLKRGVRGLILRRALKQSPKRKPVPARSSHNGADEASDH
jgi:hypothetical protein